MKQTKKLTRNQREFLEKKYKINTRGVRLVEETKDYITVQFPDENVFKYHKKEER